MFLSLKPIAVLSQKETPDSEKPGNKRANIFWEQQFFLSTDVRTTKRCLPPPSFPMKDVLRKKCVMTFDYKRSLLLLWLRALHHIFVSAGNSVPGLGPCDLFPLEKYGPVFKPTSH